MRAIWSVRPKCSHRCVSRKETPLKPVQILTYTFDPITNTIAAKIPMQADIFACMISCEGQLKGTNGAKFASFWLIFADFCTFALFLGIKAFRRCRCSQKTADFAETCLSHLVCPFQFRPRFIWRGLNIPKKGKHISNLKSILMPPNTGIC